MRLLVRDLLAMTWAAALAGCAVDRPPTASGRGVEDVPQLDLGGLDDVPDLDGLLPPRGVNPYPRYDLSYTLPYGGPEQTFTLDVEPRAGRLDVHFSIDTTGSFGGEIAALKNGLDDSLIPRLRARVADLAIGVSRFADFPVRPFGQPTDRPYELLTPITTNVDRVRRAVDLLDRPLQNGGDGPEGWIEALYQIGSGEGLVAGGATIERFVPRPSVEGSGTLGGVGFRAGSAHVVVNVTDAPSHDPFDYGTVVAGTHTLDEAAASLRAIGARLIGIASGESARAQLVALAVATGAVVPADAGRCLTGLRGAARGPVDNVCPLVFDIASDGTGLADTTADAIARYLDSLAFRAVSGATADDPRGFVTAIEAAAAAPPSGVSAPRREDRAPAGALDGVADTFVEVATRTRLTFRVHARNTRVMSEEFPQVFFVRVQLVGDGVVLSERVVRVLVPEGPKPDSAVDVSRDREASAPDDATPPDASRDDDDAGARMD